MRITYVRNWLKKMNEKCCGTCRFYTMEYLDDMYSDVGECIRYPPSIIVSPITDPDCPNSRSRSIKFPVLSYVRLCGEYMPLEKEND